MTGVSATFCSRSFRPIRCYFVAAFSRRTMVAAAPGCLRTRIFGRTVYWRRSQVRFGEFAKLVGNGRRDAQRDRSVSDGIPSEAIADPVDRMVGRPTCHAFFCAGAACFICKPKREFQLYIPVLLEMRHRNRQERDGFLVRVIREECAYQLLGELGKDHGRGDWCVERYRAS